MYVCTGQHRQVNTVMSPMPVSTAGQSAAHDPAACRSLLRTGSTVITAIMPVTDVAMVFSGHGSMALAYLKYRKSLKVLKFSQCHTHG
mgnify:CR=1 FL=1